MLGFAAALAVAMAIPAQACAADENPPFPAWLAGAWSLGGDEERWTEEFWTHPRGGVMIGASREGRDDALLSWESIRIVRKPDGSLAYLPKPNGGPEVEFSMVSQGDRSIEFANPAHDFPQRIRYWREGATLNAEISLIDGSRAVRWSYAPTGG